MLDTCFALLRKANVVQYAPMEVLEVLVVVVMGVVGDVALFLLIGSLCSMRMIKKERFRIKMCATWCG